MRKCIRCECEMRENYDVKVEYGAYGLKITKQGIFKDNLGKVRVAVCPECVHWNKPRSQCCPTCWWITSTSATSSAAIGLARQNLNAQSGTLRKLNGLWTI